MKNYLKKNSRSGGTGRRAAFRAQWALAHGGSNPPFGTCEFQKNLIRSVPVILPQFLPTTILLPDFNI